MNGDLRIDSSKCSADRVDELCDRFEEAWLRSERPRIDTFLEQADACDRGALFYELLLVELDYRRNRNEWPSRDEYLQLFPNFAEQIEAANFQYGESAFVTSAGDDDTVRIRTHQAGSRIGHFELLERLGAGAMGEVWKAWDSRLRRAVAIKLPRAPALSDADLRRFHREGQAAAQLRHPQLASILDVGRDGNTAYIVVDYVEGENLRQYLSTQWLDFKAIA